jgi:hypothetical protein
MAKTPETPAPAPAMPAPTTQIQNRQAIAAVLAEPDKGQNPQKEFADRARAAIEKATGKSDRAELDAAGEDAAPPPKATDGSSSAKGTTSAPTAGSEKSATPKATSAEPPPASTKSPDESAAAESASSRRYEVQDFRKWAEKHPDEAAEIAEKVFKQDKNLLTEWVSFQNKTRKTKLGMQKEREQTLSEARAERAEAAKLHEQVNQAAGALTPIADLWEAVRANPGQPDFDAADAAFQETAGMPIDDYMRLRARRGVVSPEMAKLRAENARLKREQAPKTNGAAAPSTETSAPPAVSEPKAAAPAELPEHDWSSELPKAHKLRQLDGWQAKLDAEMRKYYDPDLDEYSADPEKIADRVLKREIEAIMGEDDDAVPTKPKPKPKPKVSPKGDGIPDEYSLRPKKPAKPAEDDDTAPEGFAARERWALDRALKRQRGELAE